MKQYQVRSGQNIYDVALTLYGSVEGIFDLLASNRNLSMETVLRYGMVLNYHEEFIINKDIPIWIDTNKVLVKNGEHVYNHLDMEKLVKLHIESAHPEIYRALDQMTTDEKDLYWESLYLPRMVIRQQGQLSGMSLKMKQGRHMIIDWGDYSNPQIIEGEDTQNVEHCYKSAGAHIITLYGDFEMESWDMGEINGIYFALGTIYSDEFKSRLTDEKYDKLIIPQ